MQQDFTTPSQGWFQGLTWFMSDDFVKTCGTDILPVGCPAIGRILKLFQTSPLRLGLTSSCAPEVSPILALSEVPAEYKGIFKLSTKQGSQEGIYHSDCSPYEILTIWHPPPRITCSVQDSSCVGQNPCWANKPSAKS